MLFACIFYLPWPLLNIDRTVVAMCRYVCVGASAVFVWLLSNWLSLGQCVSKSVVWEGILGASESSGLKAGGHGSATGAPPGWLMRACLKSSQGEWTLFISCCTLHAPGPTSHYAMLSLHSVNRWNATLVRAHSGMKLRWTDSNMIDILRMFCICVELQPFVALVSCCSDLNILSCVWHMTIPYPATVDIHSWIYSTRWSPHSVKS